MVDKRFFELEEKIKKYLPQADFTLVEKAYKLSCEAHLGQMRKSGEPYIIHPVEVAHILADIELDTEAVAAGILHDTVEDTTYTIEDIKNLFGENIALLVDGVTKLSKIQYSTKEEQQIESFRKMFLAMAKDIRVILIKLADRLHNMRTLKSMSEEKQREKSRETMEVYAPLAHRLGMQKIKWELEDLSLRYLDPVAYHEITTHISQKRQEREEYLENVKFTLRDKLDEIGIKAHIEGRAKHFYSIYRKMYTNNISIDQIYDLLAVRIIVDTISECYATLGMVHELFKPIPGRFKDYIAMPKKNMYQSLHTSLIGPGGRPFEIQIRTWEMHKIAEVGIAAHWKYKEGVSGATDMDSKLEWVRQLLEIHKDMTDTEEFMHTLKIDLFEDEVFVFSPKGDVINLPNGSTPVDFAYAIHSAIGNKTTGAKVNGKIIPLDYKLINGDIVEIITSSVPHGPSRDWLKFIKTSQARKKINDWFKKENREENIIKGKENIEREMKRNNIPQNILTKKETVEALCKKYTVNSLEDVYAIVGYGGVPVSKIITRLKEEHRKSINAEISYNNISDAGEHKEYKSNSDGIVVKGIDNCLTKLSKCCNPVPGDDIIGYITRGRGVSIHRTDCSNVDDLRHKVELEEGRFIDVWWADNQNSGYTAEILIIANDRDGLAIECMTAVSNLKIHINAINAKCIRDGLATISLNIIIHDKEQLDKAFSALRKISGVTSVERSNQ